MIVSTQITNTEFFSIHSCSSFYVVEPYNFVYKQKRQKKLLKSRLIFKKIANSTGKLLENYKYLEFEF